PGWTLTPMSKTSLDDPETIPHVLKTTSLQQIARAEDVARVVTMLASPVCRHVTGEVLTVSGGMEGRLLWAEEEIDAAKVRERLE
ncbi:MAG: SDR family oxidoreductase, partial [Coriobacteriia bacterium]|nr:SDR family oxidoreductase [Coriobacteriia bacterium]